MEEKRIDLLEDKVELMQKSIKLMQLLIQNALPIIIDEQEEEYVAS